MCLAHLPVQLAPAMVAAQRCHRAASRSRGRRRRPRPWRCLPGGAAILPPKSSPPGCLRRRRNSLVFVKKQQVAMCLASTGDHTHLSPASLFGNITVPWMKSSCSGPVPEPASSFNNFMESWMAHKSSGPALPAFLPILRLARRPQARMTTKKRAQEYTHVLSVPVTTTANAVQPHAKLQQAAPPAFRPLRLRLSRLMTG